MGFSLLGSMALGQARSYYGFDKNDYPGDDFLPRLRRSFSFTGYWLNNPPGAHANQWVGKRGVVKADGFGFLILFNGRLDKELAGKDAAALGRADGAVAVSAARREGFPAGSILFLDQEEGGRLLPEQDAYLFAWVEAVRTAGYRPGVYCSGIPVAEGAARITTAGLIAARDPSVTLWVVNDEAPPAPGCAFPRTPPAAASSGVFPKRWFGSMRDPRGPSSPGGRRLLMLPMETATFPDYRIAPRRSWI